MFILFVIFFNKSSDPYFLLYIIVNDFKGCGKFMIISGIF